MQLENLDVESLSKQPLYATHSWQQQLVLSETVPQCVQSPAGPMHKVATRDHAFDHRTQSILIYGSVSIRPSNVDLLAADNLGAPVPQGVGRVATSRLNTC